MDPTSDIFSDDLPPASLHTDDAVSDGACAPPQQAEPAAAAAAAATPQPAAQAHDELDLAAALLAERQEWIKRMRLQFCVRKAFAGTSSMIHADGSLNQDYFRPPKGTALVSDTPQRAWTDTERRKLLHGIATLGIGRFREMAEQLLPEWSPNDLRVKTMRLMGRQNLQMYKGWRGDEAAVAAQFERNKRIGLRLGCWKNSVLVADDEGKVLEAILATEDASGSGSGSGTAVSVANGASAGEAGTDQENVDPVQPSAMASGMASAMTSASAAKRKR
ncbi:hypothetical protein BC831DRAFT_401676 [Entophlyctis helioformis]|nr:hypothetical protein BC831DRAFT_401676 [Entophlyctis helioformis]